MKVTVRLFARLREQLGREQLELEVSGENTSIGEIIPRLAAIYGDSWQQELSRDNVLCALNRTVVSAEQTLAEGDEVAFFPPVTGG